VPVYARHLRANQFESCRSRTLTLVTIILKFGLNHLLPALLRSRRRGSSPQDSRVHSTLLIVSSGLLTALLCLAAPQVSRLIFAGESARADLLQLVFLTAFFEVITLIPDSILRAKFRSATYSVLNITAFAVQVALISYLVLAIEPSVENVLLGRLGGTAFEALLFFFAARRELSLKFSLAELRGMLGFGAPLIFGQLAFILFVMIDRFFLQRYSNEKELGFYAMGTTLVSVVTGW
jgi:O-antigen/teichoic acid export membrane protein